MSSSNVIFRRFLRNPGRIGAIAPSSNGLCRELVTWLEIDNAAAVAELGPGTGAVTRELLRQKGETTRFFAVELDPEICKVFRETMPGVKLYINTGSSENADLQMLLPLEPMTQTTGGTE